MEFRVLGALEVVRDSRPVELNAAKQRILLAVLIRHRDNPVPVETLLESLWGASPPRTAADNLRVYVYHLRRALGGDRIVRRQHGYAALVGPGELDVDRFTELARQGQEAGDPGSAAAIFRRALEVWRGTPYADITGVAELHDEVRRLEEHRQAVLESRIDADLALGRHTELIAELPGLVARYPLRERFHAQLMLALHRAGRRGEALEVFNRLRVRLADELGIDPGPRLHHLQLAILHGDRTLDEPPLDVPATSRRPACPYPGLAPFGVADAPLFFGRERLVAEGMARLSAHRLLAVVGPSGSGKSSLARAGLLAELTARYETAVLRPGARPMAELATRLTGRGTPLVLLVDQCEEVFTECADPGERARFFDTLTAAGADRRIQVIVVLRADYYGHCAAHPALAGALAQAQILVGPMGEAELRRAIERPAELAGLRLVDGLTDALVADVAGRPGALPLLATALRELWERCGDGVLTLDEYVASGGVHGAVARLAERAYRELPVAQRETARRVLLRLAAPGSGNTDGNTTVRRRVPRAELAALPTVDVDSVLHTLATHRLINTDDGAVEIAHEAVLEEWPRLRAWLVEDLAGLRLHRSLTDAATVWANDGRGPEDLLRGVRLAATMDWAESRTAELTTVEAGFLAASQEAEEHAARQARERARAQARANRRLRWLTGALVVVLIAAMGAGGVAVVQRDRADDRTREADSRALAARSAAERDLDRALLLAVAATRLEDSPASRGALLSALVRAENVSAVTVLPEAVLGLALAPGDRTAVTTGSDGTIRELDLATREHRVLDRFDGHSLGRPAISPDGRTLAVSTARLGRATVVLWDLTTRRRTGEYPIGPDLAITPAWRRDGRLLALAAKDDIVLVDPSDPARPRRIPFPGLGGAHSTDLVFASAGLVAAGLAGTAVFDVATGVALFRTDVGGPIAPSPAGDAVFLGGGRTQTPAILDLRGPGSITSRLDLLPASVSRVAWHGDTLVAAGLDLELRVWRVPDLPLPPVAEWHGHTANITAVAFTAGGNTMITAGLDQRVLAWDMTADRRLRWTVGPGTSTIIASVNAFHPDGTLVATGGRPGEVVLSDTGTGAVTGTLATDPATQIVGIAFSPDGSTLVTSDATGLVRRWDVAGRRQLGAPLATGNGELRMLRFSPDGRLLLAGSRQAGTYLWDLETGDRLPPPPGPERLTAAEFAGPRVVALAGDDGVLTFVRITPEGPRHDWRIQLPSRVNQIVVAGGRLLAADYRGWLHAWDLTRRRELWPARRMPGGLVTNMSVDEHGTQLAATGASTDEIHLWDAATGVRLTDLPSTSITPYGLSFDRRRNHLVAVGDQGILLLWDLDAHTWRTTACTIAGRDLTPTEWAELAVPAPATALCAAT